MYNVEINFTQKSLHKNVIKSDVLSLMVLLANLQIHCINELRKSTLHQEILRILQKNHDGTLSHKKTLNQLLCEICPTMCI